MWHTLLFLTPTHNRTFCLALALDLNLRLVLFLLLLPPPLPLALAPPLVLPLALLLLPPLHLGVGVHSFLSTLLWATLRPVKLGKLVQARALALALLTQAQGGQTETERATETETQAEIGAQKGTDIIHPLRNRNDNAQSRNGRIRKRRVWTRISAVFNARCFDVGLILTCTFSESIKTRFSPTTVFRAEACESPRSFGGFFAEY